MEKETKQLKAVHQRDLDNLLGRFGIKEKFQRGELVCKFCKDTINRENIYAFLPESGMVNIICDKAECISFFLEYLDQKLKTKIEI